MRNFLMKLIKLIKAIHFILEIRFLKQFKGIKIK